MKKMTGAERIFTTLKHQEPDRVPHFEMYLDQKVAGAIVPEPTYDNIVKYFDWDAVCGGGGAKAEPVDAAGKYFRNEWGVIMRVSTDMAHPVEAPIKTEKDLDKWVVPDADDPKNYTGLVELVKKYKGQRAIVATLRDPFAIANDVRGAENHYMDFIRNPALIDRLSELIRGYSLKFIKNVIEIGAEVVVIGGDYATTKQPMLSHEHFAKHVIPVTKSLVKEAKSRGAFVLKHTDGNIMPIMDLILETGIDGLHPIDPLAGLDLGEMKKKYGKRLSLLGNVDCAQILTWGTVDEVREDVKRCMRQAAAGGGYICMSSNSVHSAVPPANYLAMVKAIRDFGKYPISL